MGQPIIKNVNGINAIISKVEGNAGISDGLAQMFKYIKQNNIIQTKHALALFQMGEKTKSYEITLAVPIEANTICSNNMQYKIKHFEPETMLTYTYKENMKTIQKTYKMLYEWISTHGYSTKGPVREIYINKIDEFIIETEIQIPVYKNNGIG